MNIFDEIKKLEEELKIDDIKINKKKLHYIVDLETFTTESDFYKKHKKVGVGLGYAEHVWNDEDTFKFLNVDELISWIKEKTKRNSVIIGFHNVKFDISYLEKRITQECEPRYEMINDKNLDGYNPNKNHQIKLEAGTFTNFVNGWGQHFNWIVRYPNSRYSCTFYDTLKKLPLSVEKMAKFTPFKKETEIDITKLPTFKTLEEVPQVWWNRVINDVRVVKYMIQKIMQIGLWSGNTAGSASMKDLKKTIGYEVFNEKYNVIADLDTWQSLRPCYKGGIVTVNQNDKNKWVKLPLIDDIKRYKFPYHSLANKVHTAGGWWDIKSSYVDQAVNYSQPYGLPTLKSKDTKTMLTIEFLDIKIKKGRIPCLAKDSTLIGGKRKYISNSQEHFTATIWKKEFELLKTIYNFKYDLLKERHFKCDFTLKIWFEKMFKYKRLYELKNDEAMVKIIKIYILAPTGKFGEDPRLKRKVWKKTISEENYKKLPLNFINLYCYKESCKNLHQLNGYHRCNVVELSDKFAYNPVISNITSGGRYKLILLINYKKNYLHFKYCDTDAGFFCCWQKIEWPDELKQGDDLGQWNLEYKDITTFKIIREKLYRIYGINTKNNKYECKTKGSGLPDKVKETIKDEDFKIGFKTKILKQKWTDDGIILEEIDFEIKEENKHGW